MHLCRLKNDEFIISCLVCNICALGDDVEGYRTMKEALVDNVTRAGIVHQIEVLHYHGWKGE